MGQTQLLPRRYTAAEYFALEARSEVRHEFSEGEVFAMAGESIAHNMIAQNFILALRPALRGKKCQVIMETVQLSVQENRHYTYPDTIVSCDPDDQRESRRLYHPLLIVEVLSPATSAYDRGKKFKQYQTLPSLRYYLLVAQTTWRVEWYRRNEANEWVIAVLTEPEEVLAIPELNSQLTVAQVYEETGVAQLRAEPLPETQPEDGLDASQGEE